MKKWEGAEPPMFPSSIFRVAVIGTHAPRQCGIATFTGDLAGAIASAGGEVEVIAVVEPGDEDVYQAPVSKVFRQEERSDYIRVADWINGNGFDAVCLQHEFGIYGGSYGRHITGLLERLDVPVLTTLHTILERPTHDQRVAFDEVLQLSSGLATMSKKGRQLLLDVYGVPDSRITVVPHGIPEVGPKSSEDAKARLGLSGRKVLLTFGLLSPDKGIEQVIEALPDLVEACPDLLYLVVGATHPKIRLHHGESYRQQLMDLARRLGVVAHVEFENRFMTLDELTLRLQAADVYVTPYLKREQITSGALSYAFGCGNAVVSTPYWHAEELLADGRGRLVPFGCPEGISATVQDLLADPVELQRIQMDAYRHGLAMQWPNIGRKYLKVFRSLRPAVAALPSDHPSSEEVMGTPLGLDRLLDMTDDVGLLQHATYSVPNRFEGYCLDDNARALVALTGIDCPDKRVRKATETCLAFVDHAFDGGKRTFRNFMGFDRTWLESTGSHDSFGRAIWGLGSIIGAGRRSSHVDLASELLVKACSGLLAVDSLRARAYMILGLAAAQGTPYNDLISKARRTLSTWLHRILGERATTEWPWFEDSLTYDNAVLCAALICAGQMDGDERMTLDALRSLLWLTQVQTDDESRFFPVGSDGFWRSGSERAIYDQQPLEAWSTIHACAVAYEATQDSQWLREAKRAWAWFFGSNSGSVRMVDPDTGGCFDGLTPDGVNFNLGAESTLSLLGSSLLVSKLIQPRSLPALTFAGYANGST
ncbi:MAG: glycosyltransferase family 4 protein [Armatimonadetes bacterium]|nr:glycosyltransferase family 4 protein [Armatimonadota bacterium]